MTEIDDVQLVEVYSSIIGNTINNLMDLVCPRRPAMPAKPMSWWSEELQVMKESLRLLNNRKGNGPESLAEYKSAKNAFKAQIKAAKRHLGRFSAVRQNLPRM